MNRLSRIAVLFVVTRLDRRFAGVVVGRRMRPRTGRAAGSRLPPPAPDVDASCRGAALARAW